MCKERWRTRDRLLDYDIHIVPPRPHAAGLGMVYPWENYSLASLTRQLYEIAMRNGYTDTESAFCEAFGTVFQDKQIIFSVFVEFPENGDNNHLYYDTNDNILYAWKNNEYVPIDTLLIPDTILNAGDANEN